jgi:uncharacterized protein (DUF2062 family)
MTAPEWMSSATAQTSPSPDARAQRIQTRAEQDRLNAEAAVKVEQQRLALERQKRLADEQAKRERQHRRTLARQKRAAAINRLVPIIGRRIMITCPISAPMAVAWVGQILFARNTLGWPLAAAVVFAASWELTTAFAGWMYHQARQSGDRGTIFRAATWLFAVSAGAMNYWHALDGHPLTSPTPKAVSYGAMSLVGIGLWELYASLIHRRELRARGMLPSPRPRFGLARWARYPRITYTAWSLSIHDSLTTVEEAWSAAVTEVARKKASKNEPNEVTAEVTAPVTLEVTAEPLTYATPASVTQGAAEASPAPLTGGTPEVTPTAVTQDSGETPGQVTAQQARKSPAKPASKSVAKSRKTDKELIADLEEIVADHYRANPGVEIKVQPVAKQLGIGRDRARILLDQMNVRPIRKAN